MKNIFMHSKNERGTPFLRSQKKQKVLTFSSIGARSCFSLLSKHMERWTGASGSGGAQAVSAGAQSSACQRDPQSRIPGSHFGSFGIRTGSGSRDPCVMVGRFVFRWKQFLGSPVFGSLPPYIRGWFGSHNPGSRTPAGATLARMIPTNDSQAGGPGFDCK